MPASEAGIGRAALPKRFSHVAAFDDAPFPHDWRGDVLVVGAVFAGSRMDGVVSTTVRRDGANATQRLTDCLARSKFAGHVQAILLQGIAFAGFNVVDLRKLQEGTGLPVLVVSRYAPDLESIRTALLEHVAGGVRKWRLIESAGPMEELAGLHVQRRGMSREEAGKLLVEMQQHGKLPEPLRIAHMIAGGVTTGESRHRP